MVKPTDEFLEKLNVIWSVKSNISLYRKSILECSYAETVDLILNRIYKNSLTLPQKRITFPEKLLNICKTKTPDLLSMTKHIYSENGVSIGSLLCPTFTETLHVSGRNHSY